MTKLDPYRTKFHEEFVDPDNAAFFLDREEDSGYQWPAGADRVSTEEGVEELFSSSLTEAERDELASDLNGSYPYWARRSQV
ncbi:hypothetical protein [Microbacterium sp. K24]|uniref:hypothetical protein n=1 Tax=Microbacterium sp. K24 TaxID=2305446 RepID=UPI00109D3FA2|nr:hypothetical protein [Microbacterium sp. K24]